MGVHISLLTPVILVGFFAMAEIEPVRPFTMDEAAPVLQAFSKLGHVRMVKANRFFRMEWPYVCWIDAEEFHTGKGLVRILYQYPGKALEKLRSICRSARNYNLGLYIGGE